MGEEDQRTRKLPASATAGFNDLREFYRIPESQRPRQRQEEEEQPVSILDLLGPPPEQQRSPVPKREVALATQTALLARAELLGWLGHLLFLSSFADDALTQAGILSLYITGPAYTDPARIFTFFREHMRSRFHGRSGSLSPRPHSTVVELSAMLCYGLYADVRDPLSISICFLSHYAEVWDFKRALFLHFRHRSSA